MTTHSCRCAPNYGDVENPLIIMELCGQGKMKTLVDRAFPLNEVAACHSYMEDRRQFGKLVLVT